MPALLSLLGIGGLTALLIAFETLQDVYMQTGVDSSFRTQMVSKVKDICGIEITDTHLDMFFEALVDNTFQKLDLVKTLLWANIGMVVINSIEDNLGEKFTTWKNKIADTMATIPVPSKFSKAGAISGIGKLLQGNKDSQSKKLSDYMSQSSGLGTNMINATNTGSLPKIYKKSNMDKLSPKEQATYKSVMAMLNTVQASR